MTSSLADGWYGPGQEAEILLKFTTPVTVVGTPRVWLDLGDVDGYAKFNAMSDGTNDTLLFLYIVREGQWRIVGSAGPTQTVWVEQIQNVRTRDAR